MKASYTHAFGELYLALPIGPILSIIKHERRVLCTSKFVFIIIFSGQTVAFSTFLDETTTFSKEIITFNQVLLNEPAGDYNPQTGIFTCPVSGIYMFSFVVGKSILSCMDTLHIFCLCFKLRQLLWLPFCSFDIVALSK